MAILIGVIALAVIPNIQRSRESKDISMLDSIASAANAGIANNQVSASTDKTITLYNLSSGKATKAVTTFTTAEQKVAKAVYDTVAADAGNVGSGAAQTGAKIDLIYNTGSGTGAAKITVQIVNSSGVVACKYLSDPSVFKVTN